MNEYYKYYKVLGLTQSATSADIRRAYHTLSRKFHPDKNDSPDANERQREINEAHAKLTSKHGTAEENIEMAGCSTGSDFQQQRYDDQTSHKQEYPENVSRSTKLKNFLKSKYINIVITRNNLVSSTCVLLFANI